jgi:sulfur-carrier protein adenylyltransferase/sulfurtransferase
MSIHEIKAEELRRYISGHDEKDYLLVDVRQPDEYEEGHIPGASLLPLPELVLNLATLPLTQDLIFYCRNGARSMAASLIVEEEFGRTDIHNLNGGILSWDGAVTENPPQIGIFNKMASTEELCVTAMNLEKGAMNFYMAVAMRYGGEVWSDVFERLAEAEAGHALEVYRIWGKGGTGVDDFAKVFTGLSGNILEGGMTLVGALDMAAASGGRNCVRVMELALQIEYTAFDLYRTMAGHAEDDEAQRGFLQIAQAEKSHMNVLIDALGACPE